MSGVRGAKYRDFGHPENDPGCPTNPDNKRPSAPATVCGSNSRTLSVRALLPTPDYLSGNGWVFRDIIFADDYDRYLIDLGQGFQACP